MSEIEIEIDGKPLKALPNTMLIQVADAAGIYIPRFCYHPHLTIAANCRMCLVEVEKSPKALPACATPVAPGMKVFTRSSKALAAQKAVMEFLLINHPLDCPICDQGGECELQDLSMGYGAADSYYHEGKRSVKDQDIGPLVATDMTRCIQCTRCVRFGAEVAGLRELGAVGRGENMEIGTYVQHAIHSDVSGNIIDLCPVGALTSKPFRFTARAWELIQNPSIAPHDCVGSNINVHTRRGEVMRVVPRENTEINEVWLSDRDRYSYQGVNHPDRLLKPLLRQHGELKEIDWQTAFQAAASSLKSIEPDTIGALASPNSTLEEFFLLQKLMRMLGSPHIDHRLRQSDFSDENFYPKLNHSFQELEEANCIILVGSNIQKEQPSLALRIRKAALKGAKIISINAVDYRFNFNIAAKKVVAPHRLPEVLHDIVQAKEDVIAGCLKNSAKTAILLGAIALNHPESSLIRHFAQQIATQNNATVGFLTEGCNAMGAYLAGCVPHRGVLGEKLSTSGLNAATMLTEPRNAYLLLNVEPTLDCGNPVAAQTALKKADCVIAFSIFADPFLLEQADIVFPITPSTETSGTFVNAMGTWQSFHGVATPKGQARPAWKILRVLGNFLEFSGFDYHSSEEVRDELKRLLDTIVLDPSLSVSKVETNIQSSSNRLSRIGEIPLYATDSIVRRAQALQATQAIIDKNLDSVRLHPETALKLHLKAEETVWVVQNNQRIALQVMMDDRVPLDAALIYGGLTAMHQLSELFGFIDIQKA